MFIKRKNKDEIKCNHVFNSYQRICDYKRMCQTLYLKCIECDEIVTINVTNGFLSDLFNDIYDNGMFMR